MLGRFELLRAGGPSNLLDEVVDFPQGSACISVRSDGVGSAQITLDEDELFGPSDFSPHVTLQDVVLESAAGPRRLAGRLTSMPGANLHIEVRALRAVPEPEIVEGETDLAAMQRALCNEVNLNFEAFHDQDVAAALADSMVAGGSPLGRMIVHRNSYDVPTYLAPLPTEDYGLPTSADPETIARAWAAEHVALLQLSGSELVLDTVDVGPVGEATVIFSQRVGTLPVFDSALAVFIDDVGVVRQIRAHLVPSSAAASLAPALSPSDAAEIALAALEARGLALTGEPRVVAGLHDLSISTYRADLAPAWMVRYHGQVSVYVHANTGAIREVRSHESHAFYYHVAELQPSSGTMYPRAILSVTPTRIRTTPAMGMPDEGPSEDGCFPSTGPGGGTGDPACQLVVGALLRADHFYRTVWGRDGWSNGGGSRLGEYPVIYGAPTEGVSSLSCYPSADVADSECSAATGRRVAVGGSLLSTDVITHEFGHGYLWDPTSRTRTSIPDERGVSNLVPQGFLGEHVGDVISALTTLTSSSASPEQAFASNIADGLIGRDHSVLSCAGYRAEPCDVTMIDSEQSGCREYTHADFLSNLDGPGNVHASSCIYSSVGYLLAQADPALVRRGVPTPGGVSRELLAAFYRELFTRPHMGLHPDEYWDYTTGYRNVVAAVVGKCGSFAADGTSVLAGIPECDALALITGPEHLVATQELAATFASALLAQGFWSEAQRASDWRSEIAPAAVSANAAGDEPAGTYVFFIDGSDELQYVVYEDPTDAVRPGAVTAVNLESERGTGPVRTVGPLAATIDAAGRIHVAYVESGSGLVRILQRDETGFWSVGSLAFAAEAFDGVAIAVTAEQRILIAGAPGDGTIEYYFSDSPAVEGTVTPAATSAPLSQPALSTIQAASGARTLLAFTGVGDSSAPVGRLEYQVFDGSGAAPVFLPGDALRVVSSPLAGEGINQFTLEALTDRADASRTRCFGVAECSRFIGTRCGVGLGAACEPVSCTSDAECVVAAGGSFGGVPCVDGTCADFARVAMTARSRGGGLTLLPFLDGDSLRLHVFAPSSRRRDPGDPGGLTFANLVPTATASSLGFDTFAASRQVRLPDDRFYARGYAAALFEHPSMGTVEVLFGVDRGGVVHVRWRRSE